MKLLVSSIVLLVVAQAHAQYADYPHDASIDFSSGTLSTSYSPSSQRQTVSVDWGTVQNCIVLRPKSTPLTEPATFLMAGSKVAPEGTSHFIRVDDLYQVPIDNQGRLKVNLLLAPRDAFHHHLSGYCTLQYSSPDFGRLSCQDGFTLAVGVSPRVYHVDASLVIQGDGKGSRRDMVLRPSINYDGRGWGGLIDFSAQTLSGTSLVTQGDMTNTNPVTRPFTLNYLLDAGSVPAKGVTWTVAVW